MVRDAAGAGTNGGNRVTAAQKRRARALGIAIDPNWTRREAERVISGYERRKRERAATRERQQRTNPGRGRPTDAQREEARRLGVVIEHDWDFDTTSRALAARRGEPASNPPAAPASTPASGGGGGLGGFVGDAVEAAAQAAARAVSGGAGGGAAGMAQGLAGMLRADGTPAAPGEVVFSQQTEDGRGSVTVTSGGGGTMGSGGGGGVDGGGATTSAPAASDVIETGPLSPGEEDLVRQQFGHLAWALDIPEIANILRTAAKNEWPENKLIAAVYASVWWRSTSDSQRQWIQLSAQDPGTATQRVNAVVDQLRVEAQQLGVNIPIERLKVVAENSLRFGMTTQQLTSALGSEIKFVIRDVTTGHVAFVGPGGEPGYDPNDPNKPAGGKVAVMDDGREVYYIPGQQSLASQLEVGTLSGDLQAGLGDIEREIRRIAADYLVPVSNRTLIQWLEKIAKGEMKVDDFRGYLIEQAKSLYPTIAGSLDKGITTAQYLAPYAEIAAQELDINPADIDFSQEKWNRPLNQIDPATGERTTTSLADWRVNVRTDPVYGWDSTRAANDQAAGLILNMGKAFGEAA